MARTRGINPKRRTKGKRTRRTKNEAAFNRLTPLQIGELLAGELAERAVSYTLTYRSYVDSGQQEEADEVEKEFADAVSAVNELAREDRISLDMLSRLWDRFEAEQK